MVQPGQSHRHVEGAAAHVGLDSGGPLDDVNQAFANNCEHGHTLPENAARALRVLRRRGCRGCSAGRLQLGPCPARIPAAAASREPGVDVDHVPAGPLQQAGGDPGAVAGGAVHPELPGRDVVQAQQQLVQRAR